MNETAESEPFRIRSLILRTHSRCLRCFTFHRRCCCLKYISLFDFHYLVREQTSTENSDDPSVCHTTEQRTFRNVRMCARFTYARLSYALRVSFFFFTIFIVCFFFLSVSNPFLIPCVWWTEPRVCMSLCVCSYECEWLNEHVCERE